MEEILLSLRDIAKQFGQGDVLHGIDLDVYKNEFLTLLGPSGCGKTTTLRIIAGLETPDRGTVVLNGEDVTALAPEKRSVNTVFQNYALFPHMNVAGNIGYGLRLRKVPKVEIKAQVKEMLSLVQLEGYGKRMPDQLSGGQRQRVAIARALILRPRLLLLDEPLGALDLQLRRSMQLELKRLQQQSSITFIYITHDQEEALNMSDRIAVMNDGRFEQIGTPDQIYEHPKTRFVAQFIGQTNLIDVRVAAVRPDGMVTLCHEEQQVMVRAGNLPEVGAEVTLSVRAERLSFGPEKQPDFSLTGTVTENRYIGGALTSRITLADGQELIANSRGRLKDAPKEGSQVYLWWDPEQVSLVGEAEA